MATKAKSNNAEEVKDAERKTVGNYNLGAVIGKGGFGTVFQGLDIENGDFVAVKQINLTKIPKDQLQGIMNEIDLLKNLNHANIVKYIRYVKTKECLYIVLEYVENGSLSSIIKKFGKFPETLVSVYIRQVLEGLVYLHEQGVVHRDIKGANILTTKEGRIKLADFGVATKFDDLQAASVVGTPYWMAPEIIELNGATTKADIWSVGCTVIELLTGQPPYYDLGPMPALFRIVQDDCPPLPEGISPALKDWLMQCFQKDPNLRISAQKLLKHKWILSSQKKQQTEVEEPSNIEDIAKNIQDYNERIAIKKKSGHQRKPSLHPKSPKNKLNLPPPEEDEDEWGDDFSNTPKSIKLPDKKSPLGGKKEPAGKKPSSPPPAQPKKQLPPPPLKLAKREEESNDLDWGDDFDVGSIKTQDLSKALGGLGKGNDDDDDGFGDVDFPTQIKLKLPTAATTSTAKLPASNSANGSRKSSAAPPAASGKDSKGIQDQWGENEGEDWGDVATVHFDTKVISHVRKGSVVAQPPVDFQSKLKSKLIHESSNGEDEDEDPFNEAFDDFDEEFDLDKNLMKDNYARMSEEILKLMNQLQIDQSDQVILNACEQLITIFKENPDQKSHLIRRHGVIPIMEMLEVSNPHVLCSILKVVNQIIESNMEIQENLCLVGGIPSIMKFAGRDYDSSIRIETASFVSKMCSTSTLTLQMFIACKGLPILVDFLSTPYVESKRLVCMAIDAIVNVFELQSPTPKNDFCRLFSKVGLLRTLPLVLNEIITDPPTDNNSQNGVTYPDKLINLLILFSSADSVVRRAMSNVLVIEGLLLSLANLSPDQLVKVLKSIKQLSMDHNTLGNLQAAGTIRAIIPFLGRQYSAETQNQVINTMFHLCRLDAERQYIAAAEGIIPHLQHFITTHSPLNQFALPIICDLAHSKKARVYLWNYNGVEFYIDLLQEKYWQVNALDALAVWLADEINRVEKIMASKSNINKLILAFGSAESQSFAGVLDPLLKIVTQSIAVNVALGTSDSFIPKLIERLSHTNPIVRLNLLKILSSLYECHPNSKMMIQQYKLYPIIQRISTSDKSVLNQKIALKLYEAFNANSVI